MVSKQAVEEQLKRIGCNFKFWGRSEINELGRILMEDEIIAQCVNGEYSNGFALLVATNHRLLLVDKKPFLYLTVEDYRYEMVTEFNLNNRMLNSSVNIHTTNKTMNFTSWNQHRLRKLLEYVQARVLEMRQQQHMASQFTAAAAAQLLQMQAAAQAPQYMPQYQAPEALPQPPVYQQVTPAASPQQATQLPPQSQPAESTQQRLASRFASGRASLGTYTRSKLPQFRHHRDTSPGDHQAEKGEVFPQGYPSLPYEYEG